MLDRLKRKHGGSIEAVLAHADTCRERIEEIDGAGERGEELEAELAEATERRAGLAAELSAARKSAAGDLEERVAAELDQLAMSGARLEVVLDAPSGRASGPPEPRPSSCGSQPTPGCPSRRCATRPRAASSRA